MQSAKSWLSRSQVWGGSLANIIGSVFVLSQGACFVTITLGTSDRIENVLDGTLCRQESPCPGPVGKDASRGMKKVGSIRQMQEKIRQRIREIEGQLKYLDEHHVSDNTPWISFQEISSIEDLKPKFLSLREALKNDLQVLRGYLRDLEAEARTAHRAGLRRRAANSTGEFDRDVENLLRDAEKTGGVDSSQLESMRKESDAALREWQKAVEADPSPQNMKGLLNQLSHTMMVGLDEGSDAARDSMNTLTESAQKVTQKAEKRFRDNPTVENLRDYVQKVASSLQLGGETTIGQVPAALKRLRPEKSYVVQPGDSLSGISKMFYGTPSFWDVIFLNNLKVIGDDPERIQPNVELDIP